MIAIPVFPSLRPIAKEDKPFFDDLFFRFPPEVSEYTFTNLFSWRQAYGFCLAESEGCVLVIATKPRGVRIFDPIGPLENKQAAIKRCFSLSGDAIFCRLPETTAGLFDNYTSAEAVEDRDNADYLYRTQDIVELKGRDYDAKRNFIKRFKDAVAYVYHPLTDQNVARCLDFQQAWCLVKDCVRSEGLTHERQALEEMLHHFEYLGMSGGMIEVNGKIEAVTMGERLNSETFVIHVEKANGALIGIYQAVNQMFAAAAAGEFRYINREQDLGVPGLRRAKESYHPCRMVKKHTLRKVESRE